MKGLLLLSLSLNLATALLTLAAGRRPALAGQIATGGAFLAALTGAVPLVAVLATGIPLDLQLPWSFPLGSFHLHADSLSAWFGLPVLIISALTALYGSGYLAGQVSRDGAGPSWSFFHLLSGGMLLVVLAWDGLLFLFAWEIMSIAAWFLVMFDHRDGTVRRAGWIYLAATHLGTAFLFVLFVMLKALTGTTDLSAIPGLHGPSGLLFLMALIGFGAKAGFWGLHVWLPEAHPAAPSHVSALMSGVMIKTGLYGLLRIMSLLPSWSEWWGWLLLAVGAASGLGGILFALSQDDIKRALAYSSVENMGIICLGTGLGTVATVHGHPLASLCMAGALLHVWNHAIFKTSLFLGAGSVAHAAGTRSMDRLGGLQKRLPVTAAVFLTASAAICGLPPLNGFIGEFLLYSASYLGVSGTAGPGLGLRLGSFAVIASLALIGGLAVLCFTRIYGTVFLGEQRSDLDGAPHEAPAAMRIPMAILAAACVLFGLAAPVLVQIVSGVASSLCPAGSTAPASDLLVGRVSALTRVSMMGLILTGTFAGIWALRRCLLRGRPVTVSSTWGCGYSRPTARMQYTGSSFVQPLSSAFRAFLGTEGKERIALPPLPGDTTFSTKTPDPFLKRLYEPLFVSLADSLIWVRRIQAGGVHLYVLYLILALAAVLAGMML